MKVVIAEDGDGWDRDPRQVLGQNRSLLGMAVPGQVAGEEEQISSLELPQMGPEGAPLVNPVVDIAHGGDSHDRCASPPGALITVRIKVSSTWLGTH